MNNFEAPNIDTRPVWILEKYIYQDVEWIRIVFIAVLM
jgi:hypothetical protein